MSYDCLPSRQLIQSWKLTMMWMYLSYFLDEEMVTQRRQCVQVIRLEVIEAELKPQWT